MSGKKGGVVIIYFCFCHMEIDLLFLIRNKILILKYKFVSVELQISFKVIKYMSHQVSSLSPESWHLLEKERGRREEEGSSGSS